VKPTGVVVEEPISSELVLVDEELALRARGALPDPPWLLSVLAELEEAARAEPAVAVEERPAPVAVAEAPPARRSLASRIPAGAVVVFLLFVLALLAYFGYGLLPTPPGPTLAARSEPQRTVPLKPPSTTGAAGNSEGDSRSFRPFSKPRPAAKSKPEAQSNAPAKPRPVAPTPKPKAKPRQKPKPRGIASGQRVFAWPRYPGAVYYQFYFQRGTRTIFQARTVRPRAELPASLKVLPGVYRVLVRPAIPGDAGIILGPVIVTRTVRV
jgi:hypothetical protein